MKNPKVAHLIKLEIVQNLKELAILFGVLELDIVLLQAVQGKFGFVD